MGTDLIVRFAGEGGQGQVTAAEGLAQAAARVGYHVQTYSTYPSQIKGGPVWAQTRISTKPILHDGDALDILVVLNREAYESHISELRDGGVLVYKRRRLRAGHQRQRDRHGRGRDSLAPRATRAPPTWW